MPSFIFPILCAILGYLAGSINWGYLVARQYGVDIRTVGNRNPGAANVFREIGPAQGVAVFIADILTGALVLLLAGSLPLADGCRLAGAAMVLMGTAYPIFWGFKGGTGLAKGMGVVIGVNPAVILVGLPVGLLILWRIRSTGWAGALAVVSAWLFLIVYGDMVGAGIVAMVAALIMARTKIQYPST